MPSYPHEIRDPIHVFVRYDLGERRLIDSRPFQRLRHIHQLAMTFLVYPGATHRRFEHSLGVMELANRVYDVVTNPENAVDGSVSRVVPRPGTFEVEYWRRVLRMAALCHDLGHLPFSHAAEAELLPAGWNHEHLTLVLIRSEELQPIWEELRLNPEDIAKIAVGARRYNGQLSEWEALLSEIIVSDAFGVDRMDYLIRDSHHTGVAYGRFDHYRLVDSLRILPKVEEESSELVLGLHQGGLQSAEGMFLARYFMYSQVYFHHVRRIYDIHLKDFLKDYLAPDIYPTSVTGHLAMTDNEILAALSAAASKPDRPGHDPAKRIIDRTHFRRVFEWNPTDFLSNPDAGEIVASSLRGQFGDEAVRFDHFRDKGEVSSFPVLTRDGRIEHSLALSSVLQHLPVVTIDYVFVDPELRDDARAWLQANKDSVLSSEGE